MADDSSSESAHFQLGVIYGRLGRRPEEYEDWTDGQQRDFDRAYEPENRSP